MRIVAVDARRPGSAVAAGSSELALRIETEDGTAGWAGLPANAVARLESGPMTALVGLVGADARAIDAIVDALRDDRAGPGVASVALAGAVDLALYDLNARRLGVPVYDLLGGCYRERIPLHAVAAIDVEDPVSPAAGLGALKVAVAVSPVVRSRRNEAARIRAGIASVRDRLGPDAGLVVGLDGSLPLATSIAVVRALDDLGLDRIDLDVESAEALTLIAAATRTPLCPGATLLGAARLLPLLEAHATGVVAVDVAANGFSEARRMADLAAHFDALVVPAEATDTFGLLAAVQFAAALPNVESVGLPAERDLLDAGGLALAAGELIVPDHPGLGVARGLG